MLCFLEMKSSHWSETIDSSEFISQILIKASFEWIIFYFNKNKMDLSACSEKFPARGKLQNPNRSFVACNGLNFVENGDVIRH